MEHLIEFVANVVDHLVGWRTWLCVLAALAIACAVWLVGVTAVSPPVLFVAAGAAGLIGGLVWDARGGRAPS